MIAKAKRVVKKDKVKTLSLQIGKEYEKMKTLYRDKKFGELAQFLEGREAVIVTPDYKKLRGGASAELWAKERAQGAKLDFRTTNIFFGDAIGVRRVSEKSFDSVAFITHEVHFIKKSAAVRKNDTGYMETVEKHQTDCSWFEE